MKADFEFDRYITEALKEEPDFFLPSDFTDKMTEKIRRKYTLRENLKEYSVYTVLFLGLAILVCAFLFYINKDTPLQLQTFITGHFAEIISLIFVANFILFADKVLLRLLFSLKQ